MHGNLPLAREIFLPRRSESDIKEKKQSEEYKEFRQTLKEFHTIDQNKKRKIDDNDERQKESEVQKKSTPSSKDESRKNSPKQKKIQKMVPSNVKKGKK